MRYTYVARNAQGKEQRGVIEAESREEALRLLREKGLYPFKVQEAKKSGFRMRGRIKGIDLANFTKQLSVMIGSGIPQDVALASCEKETSKEALKSVIASLRTDVSNGVALSDALRKHPKVFDSVFVSLARAGEASGDMAHAMATLSDFITQMVRIRSKVISALIYPAIVLTAAGFGTLFLVLVVFPQISDLYAQFGADLPLITRFIIGLSNFLISYWYLVLATIAGLVVGVRRWLRTPNGRRVKDTVILKIPIVGPFIKKMVLVKFTKTLAALVANSTHIVDALRIAGASSGNALIEEATQEIIIGLREGERISRRMREKEWLFSGMLVNMIASGEEVAKIDKMLLVVADHYQSEVDETASRLSTILDPILMLFVLGIVGTILIALYLPIFQVGSVLGGV